MDSALLATLRTHNPWLERPADQSSLLAASLPEPFVPRRRRLELRPGRAELVVGPRQAGKSTWIREVLTHVEAPILVLHAEEPRIRELAQSPALALDALSEVLAPDTRSSEGLLPRQRLAQRGLRRFQGEQRESRSWRSASA